MLHDLLLPLTGTAGEPDALSFAIALASTQRAHLTVSVPLHLPLLHDPKVAADEVSALLSAGELPASA